MGKVDVSVGGEIHVALQLCTEETNNIIAEYLNYFKGKETTFSVISSSSSLSNNE